MPSSPGFWAEHDANDPTMTDYLYRDRQNLSVYSTALTGMVLHDQQDTERRDMILRNIEQTLVQDDENQTAYLRMPQNSWWYWYGSENEAMARYLQLLVKGPSEKPRRAAAGEVPAEQPQARHLLEKYAGHRDGCRSNGRLPCRH